MELTTTNIFINGVDKSDILQKRIMFFEIQEHEGLQLDTLELIINNADNSITPPTNKATIELAIGFDTPYQMGKYSVNFVNSNNGIITLKGIAQDLTKGRIKQNRVFEHQPLSAILNTLASNLGLTLQCDPLLSSTLITYLLQSNQTDLSLLHELGELFYAIAMVKNGNLVFWGKDSPSGTVPIILNDTDILNITYKDTEYKIYNGAKGYFWDTKTATRQEITLGSEPCLLVPAIYGLELTKQLVKAKFKQIQQKQTLELILNGNPQIQVGVVITILPISNYIDYLGSYKITNVRHVYDGQKYTTYLSACKLTQA